MDQVHGTGSTEGGVSRSVLGFPSRSSLLTGPQQYLEAEEDFEMPRSRKRTIEWDDVKLAMHYRDYPFVNDALRGSHSTLQDLADMSARAHEERLHRSILVSSWALSEQYACYMRSSAEKRKTKAEKEEAKKRMAEADEKMKRVGLLERENAKLRKEIAELKVAAEQAVDNFKKSREFEDLLEQRVAAANEELIGEFIAANSDLPLNMSFLGGVGGGDEEVGSSHFEDDGERPPEEK